MQSFAHFSLFCASKFEGYEEKHRNFCFGSGSNAVEYYPVFPKKRFRSGFVGNFLIKVMHTFWNVRIVWEWPVTCFQRRTG